MRSTARFEVLIVENTVVLVGDLFEHEVLVFCFGHHDQIFERVVQVAAVVRVDMGRGTVPTVGRHVGHALEPNGDLRRLPGRDLGRHDVRVELKALHDREFDRSDRKFDGERARGVEQVIPLAANPGIGGVRCVEFSVRCKQVDP